MKYFERLKIAANAVDVLKRYGIYAVLLVLVIFFAVTSENFFQSSNLLNVARQVSMLGIASVGFAFVLLLGGIDLSIGSVVTLVNIVTAWLMVTATYESYFGEHFGFDHERSDRIHEWMDYCQY